MATAAFLLLFLFFSVTVLFSSTITTTTTAQQTSSRNSNITIDSFLSPTNNTNSSSSWLSRSGLFAFGFYPLQDGGFVVGIWFAGIPQKTVVWTAPVLVIKQTDPNNFRLRLTRDQGLVLQSTQGQSGQDQSISVDLTELVAYASMLDTGNMVLYNSNSTIIWQSFDYPTNTILQGQRFRAGESMFSSVSETDYSKGSFQLAMKIDGNLVEYPSERHSNLEDHPFWSSDTFDGNNVTLNLDDDGLLYLLNSTGFNIKNLTTAGDDRTPSNETIFYRMTVDGDGIFRVYSHNLEGNGNWSIEWNSTNNKCDLRGICGLNSYCTLIDQDINCRCLPGFNQIDSARPILGCERDNNVKSCRSEEGEQSNYTMDSVMETTWEDDSYSVLTRTTAEKCKNYCLNDCSCVVAMFEDQSCRKQRLPLRYGRRVIGSNITVFIKVGTKNTNATTPITPTTDGMIKKSKRSKKELKSTVLIAGVSFVSGFLLVIAISGFLVYAHRSPSCYKILPLILKLKEKISAKKNRLCAAQ